MTTRRIAEAAARRLIDNPEEGLTPAELLDDEETRRTVPNRAARRLRVFGNATAPGKLGNREHKRRGDITDQRFALRQAKRAEKAAAAERKAALEVTA